MPFACSAYWPVGASFEVLVEVRGRASGMLAFVDDSPCRASSALRPASGRRLTASSNCFLASGILPAFHRMTPWLNVADALPPPPPRRRPPPAAATASSPARWPRRPGRTSSARCRRWRARVRRRPSSGRFRSPSCTRSSALRPVLLLRVVGADVRVALDALRHHRRGPR